MSRRMQFGKYKGKKISDVPTDYLIWCFGSMGDSKRKTLVRIELERRGRRIDWQKRNAEEYSRSEDRELRRVFRETVKDKPIQQTNVKPAIPPASLDVELDRRFANVAQAVSMKGVAVVPVTPDECPY